MHLLTEVMNACRSGDATLRMSAAQMVMSMDDLSEDETSPNHENHLSYAGYCTTMDEVENALRVGQRIASLGASLASGATSSSHVDRVADAMLREIDGGDGDEEMGESEDSDEFMESPSERRQRYQNAELCEVSDPEEWMAYHHGDSDGD